MKCPRCWADKAYLHEFRGWWEVALGWLAFRPMRCSHCYHRYMVHWVLTIGKSVVPPVLRVTGDKRPTKPVLKRDPDRPRRKAA